MLDFLARNLGTILISALVVLIVAFIVVKMIKDRKKGGACACGCDHCPNSADCCPTGNPKETKFGEDQEKNHHT